ncbi:MAG: ABC transporter ATP-binding protein [Muribaculaceae bacterium]|nr:ABC transporter ATP-binding protein [Muribaculaceae bacterium]
MLKIKNLSYSYPGNSTPVISDLQLEIQPGAIYGLLGANGTGKSTLLYLISGLLKPATGKVTFNNDETIRRLPKTLSEIFLVAEEFDLPSISLDEYVRLNAPFYPRFSIEQMHSYLEHFRLSADIHLGHLSMGQRKKAFIAFALACNTSLLLMDEPTNGLDIPGKAEFRRAIVSASSSERTIIISTHQVRDLEQVLDHVAMIDRKGLILNTSIAAIQNKLQFIFAHNPAECAGALWSSPVAGGYSIIRRRDENMDETDVNLESLFELAYSNPEIINAL